MRAHACRLKEAQIGTTEQASSEFARCKRGGSPGFTFAFARIQEEKFVTMSCLKKIPKTNLNTASMFSPLFTTSCKNNRPHRDRHRYHVVFSRFQRLPVRGKHFFEGGWLHVSCRFQNKWRLRVNVGLSVSRSRFRRGTKSPDERLSLKSQWHRRRLRRHKGLAWLLQIGEQSVSEKTEARGKHWRERRIIVIGKKKKEE